MRRLKVLRDFSSDYLIRNHLRTRDASLGRLHPHFALSHYQPILYTWRNNDVSSWSKEIGMDCETGELRESS
jgi:hypothetical protein